ncbi:MAG: preprotein translocase subunit SecE [Clostridia bacterium]|nr:preprotein translocase subunit SecE [Clostridia bacterium]
MANKELKSNKDKKNSLKSVRAELKKVTWPTPKQLANNTLAVVAIVIVISVIVFVLDLAFESANKYGVDKIKQIVVDSKNVQEENTNPVENSENIEENSNESEENGTSKTEAPEEEKKDEDSNKDAE